MMTRDAKEVSSENSQRRDSSAPATFSSHPEPNAKSARLPLLLNARKGAPLWRRRLKGYFFISCWPFVSPLFFP
jgi:hypothetical protein